VITFGGFAGLARQIQWPASVAKETPEETHAALTTFLAPYRDG
jgi:hypothetical protein